MKIPSLLLVTLLAPASAQTVFQPSQSTVAYQEIAAARARLSSLSGTGASLLRELDAKGVTIAVVPDQTAPCATYAVPGRSIIACNDSLANEEPAYAALRVTEQAAALRLADMPASAEKDYMQVSLYTRSWVEAGGQLMSKRALADKMGHWWHATSAATFPSASKPLAELLAANAQALLAARAVKAVHEHDLARANCESDERGIMTQMGADDAEILRLEKEAVGLKAWLVQVQLFVKEERYWLDAWMPT